MPPRRGPQCQLFGQYPGLSNCNEPMTYSERGHPLAGDYCDKHGLAVHRLRRGSPCPCGHCDGARGRVQRNAKLTLEQEAAKPSREEESDAD
jgi:hypothetical protein